MEDEPESEDKLTPKHPKVHSVAAYKRFYESGRQSRVQDALVEIFVSGRRYAEFEIDRLPAWKAMRPKKSTLTATLNALWRMGLIVTIGERKNWEGEYVSIYSLREYVNNGQKYLGSEHEHRCICPKCGSDHLARGKNKNLKPVIKGKENDERGNEASPSGDS